MIVAIEDALSEALVTKILGRAGIKPTTVLGRRGNQYLRSKCRELNRAASGQSVMILTDLDSHHRCPSTLRSDWLPDPQSERLMFRVAVLEAEAWVLAHRAAFAEFAGIAEARIPSDPEGIDDPKRKLVNLCRLSRQKAILDGMVPAKGSTALVGPEYNARLALFVQRSWDPSVAALRSPSLQRTLQRLDEHVQKFFRA